MSGWEIEVNDTIAEQIREAATRQPITSAGLPMSVRKAVVESGQGYSEMPVSKTLAAAYKFTDGSVLLASFTEMEALSHGHNLITDSTGAIVGNWGSRMKLSSDAAPAPQGAELTHPASEFGRPIAHRGDTTIVITKAGEVLAVPNDPAKLERIIEAARGRMDTMIKELAVNPEMLDDETRVYMEAFAQVSAAFPRTDTETGPSQ